jgi:hypothetical protein
MNSEEKIEKGRKVEEMMIFLNLLGLLVLTPLIVLTLYAVLKDIIETMKDSLQN